MRYLRAYLNIGWDGLPARLRRQPAAVPSGGLVARRNRPVACSTRLGVVRHAFKRVGSIGMLGLIILGVPACNTVAPRASFATPDEAAAALHQAFKTEDLEELRAIFGRKGMEAVASGDAVSDRQDRAVIALAMDQSWRWEPVAPTARN